MNIVVVSNCQCQPLAHGLQLLVGSGSVMSLPIHLKGTNQFSIQAERFEDLLALDPDTLILTINLGPKFDEFSTESLRSRFRSVKTITNIFFTGLHPDCTYLSVGHSRITSPIGDYNSKIILASFAIGLNQSDCHRLFCEDIFEHLGYWSEFSISASNLRAKELEVDIAFADQLVGMCTLEPSLFTFNHPTSAVFFEWISSISKALNLKKKLPELALMPNTLASNAIFPIYPEIAQRNACRFSPEMSFIQPQDMGGKRLELDEFIAGSYNKYQSSGQRFTDVPQLAQIVEKLKCVC